MPLTELRQNTVFISLLVASVVMVLVFHAVEHGHVHPSDAALGMTQKIQSHTHANGATHTHHADTAAAESTTQEALAEIGYTFHYRESEETLADLLIVIAFGAFALFSFFSIERIRTRGVIRNATEGTYTDTVLAPRTNIRLLDPLFIALRRGILKSLIYG